MNLYTAIMKASDHIEKHPESYSFTSPVIPRDCGTPGCAIGWIAHFAGAAADMYMGAAVELFGFGHFEFYKRMSALEGATSNWSDGKWPSHVDVCIRDLRLYAEKYHGHEKPQRRPTSELVTDLMARVMAGRIPEGMLESAEYGQ